MNISGMNVRPYNGAVRTEKATPYETAKDAYWDSPTRTGAPLRYAHEHLMEHLIGLAVKHGADESSPAATFAAHLADLAYMQGATMRTVQSRLKRLEEAGLIAKKPCGSKGVEITIDSKYIFTAEN